MGKIKARPDKSKNQTKKNTWRVKSKKGKLIQKTKNRTLDVNHQKERTMPSRSSKPKKSPTAASVPSLRERMMKRLEAARFRQVNEELDSLADTDPKTAFASNISNFENYHKAYRERIETWPQNPLDAMIKYIQKRVPVTHTIADFGCGEAKLAAAVSHEVHSFDLFALNDLVTACDMSSTPLKDQSVDLAIFCLSLMGTEVGKYIAEANRVLKQKGILRIAEVTSRFPQNNATTFIKRMKKFGFVTKDRVKESKKSAATPSDQVFLLLEFLKLRPVQLIKGKLPSIRLSPCAYKKR